MAGHLANTKGGTNHVVGIERDVFLFLDWCISETAQTA